VVKGSSELGMTEREVQECDPDVLYDRMEAVTKRFKAVGADYVIESIGELDTLIPKINLRLAQKER
jgi:phosphonoacetaldehyde hydrolase